MRASSRVSLLLYLVEWEEIGRNVGGINTLHVLFSLIHNESVAPVLLLCGCIIRSRDVRDDAYPFNGTEAAKFTLEVFYFGIVAQASNEQSLEGITANLRVVARTDCE
jgi:hypothetical protein